MPLKRSLAALVAAASLAMTSVATPAHAADAQLDRLTSAGHSLKWNWVPQGRTERFGHAEVLIAAPLAAVRAQVTDFGHYKEFAPDKFKTARMVAKEGPNTDVYFALPIMHGVVNLWYVTRFGPPRASPGVEVVEGKFVRGNIKDMSIVMTMRPVDDRFTILSCDLLVLPNVPAPQAAIDEELRDAAMQAVDAIHDRAQGNKRTVPFAPAGGAVAAPAAPAPAPSAAN